VTKTWFIVTDGHQSTHGKAKRNFTIERISEGIRYLKMGKGNLRVSAFLRLGAFPGMLFSGLFAMGVGPGLF